MANPDEQGTDGVNIQQVADNVQSALRLRLDVILLHVNIDDTKQYFAGTMALDS
jgi:hypothetical protein